MQSGLVWLMVGLGFGACKFTPGNTGANDASGPATVGFAQSASLEDEASGLIHVPVILSKPASEVVTVAYTFMYGWPGSIPLHGKLTFKDGKVTAKDQAPNGGMDP